MPRTSQLTQVGKRKIELSNLGKVLYPEGGIVKAQVIEYYLKIAPTILRHIKGRALSLVRYPDGIHGETFFQKQKPDWAPEWIESVTIGDEKKSIDYVIATEPASLVWLANLACLELHQAHARSPNFEQPDYFVFDLDPPEGFDFRSVVETAFELKDHVESFGYHPFVKTSGKKGLHIILPIESRWSYSEVFEAAKDLAKPFVESRQDRTTLHIRKDRRKGRILIDIYRNRPLQTIVSAYSLRGAEGATVSMPLTWEELETLSDPKSYTLLDVVDKVFSEGDAWDALPAYAVRLHTAGGVSGSRRVVAPSRTKKTPEQLKEYERKRSFERTPEPAPGMLEGQGNAFVVHRHHASRLHYDLRLEHNGALRSWAIPRGLPQTPGIMRLAVEVEDHPLEYLGFEGEIPKGQYGGGKMWIYALGRYEITKRKKTGFYFRLQSKEINAEYRIHKTKGHEWLLERVDQPQVDWLNDEISFMLPVLEPDVPTGDDRWFELKWDGIRAMISIDDGEIRIRSRNQHDISAQFPELLIPNEAFRVTNALFDAEIVCFDADGKPDFKRVVNRLRHTNERTIARAQARHPAHCYLFDCLYLDGRALVRDPLVRRRDWLLDVVKRDTPYRVGDVVDDGQAFFKAVKSMGLEGIVAKDPSSPYQPGKRSRSWIKVKVRDSTDCVILGYTIGKGDRSTGFGALQIAEKDGESLIYRGKVGTGFTMAEMKSILSKLNKIRKVERPIDEKPVDDAETTWIEPKLYCEVQYASLTKNGTYREPVFLRLRPDLND